jgi:hypothetical protein
MALQPFCRATELSRLYCITLFTVGRIPWTEISTLQGHYLHRTTQTEEKYTNINSWSAIPIHGLGIRACKMSSCLRLRGHCDQRTVLQGFVIQLLVKFQRRCFKAGSLKTFLCYVGFEGCGACGFLIIIIIIIIITIIIIFCVN